MKKRNPFAVVVLSIITLGIYDLYWLVKTKKVLNEKTKFHTPTIWLLLAPYIVLAIGYGVLFASAFSTVTSNAPSSNALSPNAKVEVGEQLNTKGTRRPPQYLHICNTANNIQYVSQGTPKCLGNDTYQSDYSPSVAGTVFSSPCKTTSGTVRYVYISNGEACPDGTKLIFYNNLGSSISVSTPNTTNSTSSSNTGTQLAHPALSVLSFGLIAVGFLAVFIISILWFFQFSKAINEYTAGKMSTAVTFLILWLIHLIGVALIQDTFNDMEDAKVAAINGPANPTGQVVAPQPQPPITMPTTPVGQSPQLDSDPSDGRGDRT